MTNRVKPDGFVIYSKSLQSSQLLPDESAGRVLKAAARLFLTGEMTDGLELSEQIVLSLFAGDIEGSLSHHAEVCARNKRIAASRKAPVVTTGDDSSPVDPNRKEPNRKEPNREEPNREENKARNGADEPPARTRFIPPTEEEIAAYCHERQNGIDARRFFDYYAANGWKVGKNSMKDWKAAVRTWERRDSNAGQAHS